MRCAVYSSTKVINFLLITTGNHTNGPYRSCLFLYKGNQFFANHNVGMGVNVRRYVVYPSTKVINFLLITAVKSVLA